MASNSEGNRDVPKVLEYNHQQRNEARGRYTDATSGKKNSASVM